MKELKEKFQFFLLKIFIIYGGDMLVKLHYVASSRYFVRKIKFNKK